MRKLILGLAAATALSMSSGAFATTHITPTEGVKLSDEGGIMSFLTPGPDANGIITASIGHSGILAGDFTDFFDFTIDANGTGSGSLSTDTSVLNGIFSQTTNLDITSVTVNGLLAQLVLKDENGLPCGTTNAERVGTCGTFETWAIQGVNIVAGVQNQIIVSGTSRGNGAFGGSATFVPAVPEPATWGMMLLGFGAVGFAMRRRRRPAALAQIA